MPRLRSLSGADIIKILESFGFDVISIKGSHHKLRRIVDEQKQTLNVPVHGKKPIAAGTPRSIYQQASAYIPEDDLKPHFYTVGLTQLREEISLKNTVFSWSTA